MKDTKAGFESAFQAVGGMVRPVLTRFFVRFMFFVVNAITTLHVPPKSARIRALRISRFRRFC